MLLVFTLFTCLFSSVKDFISIHVKDKSSVNNICIRCYNIIDKLYSIAIADCSFGCSLPASKQGMGQIMWQVSCTICSNVNMPLTSKLHFVHNVWYEGRMISVTCCLQDSPSQTSQHLSRFDAIIIIFFVLPLKIPWQLIASFKNRQWYYVLLGKYTCGYTD